MELTSAQRKALSAQAHELKPVVIIGQAGVTDGVMGKIAESLKAHELIKIKFNEYKEDKQKLAEEIFGLPLEIPDCQEEAACGAAFSF